VAWAQALAGVAASYGCGSSLSALATSWPPLKYACFNGTPATAAAAGANTSSVPPPSAVSLGARVSGLTLWGRCSSAPPGPLAVANLTPPVGTGLGRRGSGSVTESLMTCRDAHEQVRIEVPSQGMGPTQRLACRLGLRQTFQVACS
jgi:hypothetical protein